MSSKPARFRKLSAARPGSSRGVGAAAAVRLPAEEHRAPSSAKDGARTPVTRIDKPWGFEVLYALGPGYAGKILHVQSGKRLSRQFHRVKTETLYVQSGAVEMETGRGEGAVRFILRPGEACHLPAGTVHRLTALEDTDILEVSTPELGDVVRLEDDYGRS